MRALPFTAVTIDDRFWAPRQKTNTEATIPHELAQCRKTGRIDNFALNLRVPGWCEQFEARVNGRIYTEEPNSQGYLSITREWHADDKVELRFDMPVVRVYAHPLVRENVGRFALRRGPIVYCFEDVDNSEGVFHTLALSGDVALETMFNAELLEGVTLIRGMGTVLDAAEWENNLYLPVKPKTRQLEVTAIPYYAWCNRGTSQMSVWVL